MTKLTTKQRHAIPSSAYGLPAEKKYPMPDREHAANAKSRATEMEKKGKLSVSNMNKIDTKANAILAKTQSKKK